MGRWANASKQSKAAASNSVTLTHTQESLKNLIDLYEAWDKSEQAHEWRAKRPRTDAVEEWHRIPKTTRFLDSASAA
jgi:hypothetical protein